MNNKIIYEGKSNYDSITDYKRLKHIVRKNSAEKYSVLIKNEKNYFKKCRLIVKKYLEIKEELRKMDTNYSIFLK
jgi:hypothetical protein